MKRPLVVGATALVALLAAAPFARAQSGYSGGWTDPAATRSIDGKPLAYLDDEQVLSGEVSHPNGISSVSAVIVPDPDNRTPDGCEAALDPNVAVEPNGSGAVFRVTGTFPCNLVYELRANAQANRGSGLGASTPPTYAMPLLLAVALPPASVEYVDATLEVDGKDREVLLEWPGGPEPDLLGYVIARDGETLDQVDAGERTRFVDDDPPAGKTSRYSVTAVRDGPDGKVEQVAARATTVDVDVPADSEPAEDADGDGQPDEGGSQPVDPQIAGEQAPAAETGRPDAGGLSSVRARGQAPPSLGPPTTLDTGYQETLPFDPRDPESQVAAAPGGDPAVVTVFEESDPLDEKQRLAFIAGGLAVLVGAAVIFYVTRRAARAAY